MPYERRKYEGVLPAAVKTNSLEKLYEAIRHPKIQAAYFAAPTHQHQRDFAVAARENLIPEYLLRLKGQPSRPIENRFQFTPEEIAQTVSQERKQSVHRVVRIIQQETSFLQQLFHQSTLLDVEGRIGGDDGNIIFNSDWHQDGFKVVSESKIWRVLHFFSGKPSQYAKNNHGKGLIQPPVGAFVAHKFGPSGAFHRREPLRGRSQRFGIVYLFEGF